MKRKVSVKTIDGSRNDFIVGDDFAVEEMISAHGASFFRFQIDKGYKFFNVRNVVSITEQTCDE